MSWKATPPALSACESDARRFAYRNKIYFTLDKARPLCFLIGQKR